MLPAILEIRKLPDRRVLRRDPEDSKSSNQPRSNRDVGTQLRRAVVCTCFLGSIVSRLLRPADITKEEN